MPEIVTIAISGANFFPTVLFLLVLIYWLISLIGALDIDIFDIDIDFEAEGLHIDIFSFLKLNNIPVTIYITMVVFISWIMCISITLFTGISSGTLGYLYMVLSFPIAILCTSFLTIPLKGVFKGIGESKTRSNENLKGQLCTLKFNLTGDKISQATIEDDEAEVLINVKKSRNSEDIPKGGTGLVIKEDESKQFYIIEHYNEWE